MSYLLNICVTAVALWVTTLLFDPHIAVHAESTFGTVGTFLLVALIFGVINGVLKPIIKVLGCALYALTLGLFALVVNALLFLLVDVIAEQFGIPFHIDGFWYALLGAVVVAIVTWLLNLIIPDQD
ncbi:MAG TPA: phage holin family protein [Candidatus Stackebrandtia faecavium]|nr:phage holin family protein [Candidatus Stackebrandtia faecavium]